MTWSNLVVQTTSSTESNLTLAGRVTGVDGKRYRYSINYRFRAHDGGDPSFSATIRLVPIHRPRPVAPSVEGTTPTKERQ